MRSYQYTISLEDLISRIPGLFPSMQVCKDGSIGPIMPSGMFENGCWGNIVPDLKVPELVTEDFDGYISYGTLMKRYYNGDEDIKDYVEKGIGKRYFKEHFNSNNAYEEFMKEQYKTPSMVYIATIASLIKEYEYYQNICNCYNAHKDEYDKETRRRLCCLCERYKLMGGDEFLEWIKSIENDVPIFEYKESALSVIPVTLYSTITDLGFFDLYTNRWTAGKQYVEGEIVTYKDPVFLIDDSYVCIKANGSEGYYDRDKEITLFPIEGNCPKDSICFIKINDEKEGDSEGRQIVDWYDCKPSTDEVWGGAFEKIDGNIGKVEYTNRLNMFEHTAKEGTALYCESNLTAVRRSKTYLNFKQLPEYPSDEEDWLFYYRKGTVNNIETLQDELGNISVYDENSRVATIGSKEEKLYAYGDALINVTIDKTNQEVIFEYAIGAHLKATLREIEIDIDGNKLYKYEKFEYDEKDKLHGIVFKETHKYTNDSDWEYIIANFDNLMNGNVDPYIKGAFAKSSNREVVTFEDYNNITSYVAELAQYTFKNNVKPDYLHSPLMRKDSTIGISYRPNLDIDIYINRGNAAAFERHIKLGEVKTMEDLENYANGSFFNIQNLE